MPLIGCLSHRLNLPVNDMIEEDNHILSKGNRLMVKFRKLAFGSKLRQLLPLRRRILNVTRWSSAFEMLHRFLRMRDFLPQINFTIVDEMALTVAKNRRVECLVETLMEFEAVTNSLQDDETSMSDVRAIFDTIIGEHPEAMPRLSSAARILHCRWFESAIIKLQRKSILALTSEERFLLKLFKTGFATQNNPSNEN